MDKIVISKPEEAAEDRLQMLDLFRFLHPDVKDSFTCWNTQKNARSTNYGTRIDYLLVTPGLAPSLSACSILSDLMGSDHCPVRAELKLQVADAGPPPSLCSKFLFLGRQQKLHKFFTTKPKEQQNGPSVQTQAAKSGVRKQIGLVGYLQKKSEASRQKAAPASGETRRVQVEKSRRTPTQKGPLSSKSRQPAMPVRKAAAHFTGAPQFEVSPLDPAKVTSYTKVVQNKEVVSAWKGLLTGPQPVPPCDGHNEPCVVRTVRKAGPNLNRQFYCCARGEGHKDNPEGRCNFFQWSAKR